MRNFKFSLVLASCALAFGFFACDDNNDSKKNVCEEGAKRCVEKNLEKCTSNAWTLQEACTVSCDASNAADIKCTAETVVCTDGEKRCNANGAVETCVNNKFGDGVPCEGEAKCTGAGECITETPEVKCGNDIIDGDDVCDGTAVHNKTCSDYKAETTWKEGGTPGCDENCKLTQGSCEPEDTVATCGNKVREGDEECDGSDLGTDDGGEKNDCVDATKDAYAVGGLRCTADCKFDVGLCVYCGNNIIETGDGMGEEGYRAPEVCDGTAFGDNTCATLVPGSTGDLVCENLCMKINTDGCKTN